MACIVVVCSCILLCIHIFVHIKEVFEGDRHFPAVYFVVILGELKNY